MNPGILHTFRVQGLGQLRCLNDSSEVLESRAHDTIAYAPDLLTKAIDANMANVPIHLLWHSTQPSLLENPCDKRPGSRVG